MRSESDLHRKSRRYHSAKAQFHRWFQLYERPRTPDLAERQLQLLADHFEIVTVAGDPVRTREGYRERIMAHGPEDRYGHRVKRVTVEEFGFYFLRMRAEVHSQHLGPSGMVTGTHMVCDGELTGSVDFEPLFTRLKFTPIGITRDEELIDTYPENRARALVHRWLSLNEEPSLGAYAYDELIAPDGEFTLMFGTAPLTDRCSVAAWLQSLAQRLATGRHVVEAFRMTEVRDGKYTIGMDIDCRGSAESDPMAGRVRHEWTLLDTAERYCRILTAQATPIVPVPGAAIVPPISL
ncbi:hypothetical protein [Streptomyces sp. NPDC001774]